MLNPFFLAIVSKRLKFGAYLSPSTAVGRKSSKFWKRTCESGKLPANEIWVSLVLTVFKLNHQSLLAHSINIL